MKNIKSISELNKITKEELLSIANEMFRLRLRGDKAQYIYYLEREFKNYGTPEYDIIIINKILSNDFIESDEIIESDKILLLKYLKPYEIFLYKYILGYKKLYEDKKEEAIIYDVDYAHIFKNQFNTICNKRIFESEFFIIPSKGYTKLKEEREKILACGYCGAQYNETTKDGFCHKCKSSEYLKEEDYKLLELIPIADSKKRGGAIPGALIAEIKEAQKEAKKLKALKEIEHNKARIINKIAEIKKETEVLEYLLNNDDFILLHGLYIYYTHSNTLCFKWEKEKVTPELKSIILKYKEDMENKLKIIVNIQGA